MGLDRLSTYPPPDVRHTKSGPAAQFEHRGPPAAGSATGTQRRQTVGARYHRRVCMIPAELVAGAVGSDEKIGGPAELMAKGDVMDVQLVTSVAVSTPDPSVSRGLYVDALGLPLTGEGDAYLHSEDIGGCKSFGVWPLSQAA